MAENSKIEWTDHTFNPWIGCTKVSPACDGCYAENLMAHRYGRVQRLRLNKYFPVNLFDFHGHVAVQSEKIETYQALHAQYPQRQGHYRDRVTSQLRAAA